MEDHTPDTFDGSNPEDLQAFLLQCQITFNSYLQQYATDTAKVFFTISYLKKTALEWFEQGILEDDLSLTPVWRHSWAEFAKELKTHFGPANPVGSAKIELRHLVMASNTKLSEYLVQFNTLALCVGWGKQALCFQFYNGLPEHLKDQLAMLGKPDSLCKLVLVTQQYDNLYWERQEECKLACQWDNKPTTYVNLRGPNTSNPPSTQTNDHVLGPDGKLKLEEWKHHKENNLCMMCGKLGHTMPTCPVAMRGQAVNLQEQLDMPNTVQEE